MMGMRGRIPFGAGLRFLPKTLLSLVCAVLLPGVAVRGEDASVSRSLETRFADPPESARLETWWHWCSDNVTEAGIAADLAAMKEFDIGVAHVFSARMMDPMPGIHTKLLTPEWKKLFAFAVAEAKRRGIALGFHNCPGWSSSGGPWIRPEDSMKVVVSAACDVRDPSVDVPLPVPRRERGFYRDIATFAYPLASARPPMDVADVNSSTSRYGYRPAAHPETPGVAKSSFVDVTDRVSADAVLPAGTLPAGEWRVLRIGYTTSGHTCGPATLEGLECDKLSKSGLDAHWPHFPRELLSVPGAREALRFGIVDSFEVGGQNWTESLPDEFLRRRGYDLRPYLPALAGVSVGTDGETAKFLFDFQRTVADLIAENYYDYFAELCHREGLLAVTEAYGGPFDPLRCFRTADVPAGEFWLGSDPRGTPRLAASAAHVNGHGPVAAEAFTTEAKEGRWQVTPHELRVSGDRGWFEGVSRLVFHSYVSQPLLHVKPGLSLGRHGSQLNRNTTWWKEGKGWSRYVRRGQFLLQAGEPVAETLVLTGDGRPCFFERPWQFVQAGYQFDFIGQSDFLRLEAVPGGVRAPGGATYPILSLGSDVHLTLATLRKTKELLDGGVRIAGRRPLDTPSLADDPAEWSALADEIWNGRRANLVEENWDPLVAARKFGLPPPIDSKERLGALRRRIEGRDFFFVLNDRDEPFSGDAVFAAEGVPSRWDAKTGLVEPLRFHASGAGFASIPLTLPPHGSLFIGFDPSSKEPSEPGSATDTDLREVADLSEGWTISAFEGPCAPSAPMALGRLADWSASSDPRLRYFAGHATYGRTIDVPPGAGPFMLDLGDVRDIATVAADGKSLGTLWEAPYRVRLPEGISGRVELRVTVVNTWPNRLIGDAIARKNGAAEPRRDGVPVWVLEDRPDSGTGIFTWSNFDWGWTADDPLRPAGLLGPVRLLAP